MASANPVELTDSKAVFELSNVVKSTVFGDVSVVVTRNGYGSQDDIGYNATYGIVKPPLVHVGKITHRLKAPLPTITASLSDLKSSTSRMKIQGSNLGFNITDLIG